MMPDKRVCSFHVGQVWESSRGYYWKVTELKNGQARMRQGIEGNGRIKIRDWDAVIGWVLHSDPEYPDHNKERTT